MNAQYYYFVNDTAPTEIYPLSLHDALPIWPLAPTSSAWTTSRPLLVVVPRHPQRFDEVARSEEHTSELQSRLHLVCRLLLEKKKNGADQTSPFSSLSISSTPTPITTIHTLC